MLVTGVNGYIASHTADQLLALGYKIRGTVRDHVRTLWVQSLFDEKYGKGKFELAVVPDIAKEGAFDDVVKGTQVSVTASSRSLDTLLLLRILGVSGIAHIAGDVSFSADPNVVIAPTIASAINLLVSAAKESSVKRIACTSSSWAQTFPTPNTVFEVTTETWNDSATAAAWAPPPYTMDRAMAVYAASKVETERACWKWVAEQKPGFVFSTIVPSGCFGPGMHGGQSSPTLKCIRTLVKGDLDAASKTGVAPRTCVSLNNDELLITTLLPLRFLVIRVLCRCPRRRSYACCCSHRSIRQRRTDFGLRGAIQLERNPRYSTQGLSRREVAEQHSQRGEGPEYGHEGEGEVCGVTSDNGEEGLHLVGGVCEGQRRGYVQIALGRPFHERSIVQSTILSE